ncbi:MAG: hypothetical protein EOO67_02210 [Microbacterium sp.]|nr:MAG: hypothetical protein EOO67_02210 [Microbacterium sp.]
MSDIPDQLVLDPLSPTSWRLCDQSFGAREADSVVAYVEQRRDGRYGVTWVSRGVGTATFDSLEEVLRSAHALFEASRPRGATKPIPIPHRPPLALT